MSPGHFAPVAQRTPPFRFNNHLEQHSLLLSQRQPVEPAAQAARRRRRRVMSARYGGGLTAACAALAGIEDPACARVLLARVELADHAEAERNVQDWINAASSDGCYSGRWVR